MISDKEVEDRLKFKIPIAIMELLESDQLYDFNREYRNGEFYKLTITKIKDNNKDETDKETK